MKKKYEILSIFVLSTLFLGNLSTLFISSANEEVPSFDFVNDSISEKKSLLPSEVLKKITKEENISNEEINYVDTFDNYKLTYSLNPNMEDVEVVDYKNELYITAKSFSYVDKYDRNLSWIPTSLTYKGSEYPFIKTNGEYKASLSNYDGNDKDIKVKYSLDLTLDKNKVNTLINASYDFAKLANEKVTYNKNKIDLYHAKMDEYQNYINALNEYNSNKAKYEQYLIDKASYDVKYENYQKYLESYEKYLLEKEKYDENQRALAAYDKALNEYNQYIKDLEYYNANYEANKILYEQYKDIIEKIEYRLSAMNLIYTPMTRLSRTIFDAVNGGTVTSVLSRGSDINLAFGISLDAIDRAKEATSQLRKIFNDYKALQDEEAKYYYYKANWKFIRNQVNELTRCLTYFLDNTRMFNYLKKDTEGRLEKYYILVAQLIYLSNTLTVGTVYNYEAYNPSTNTGNLKLAGAAVLDDKYLIRVDDDTFKTYKEILGDLDYLDISLSYPDPKNEEYYKFTDSEGEVITLLKEPTKKEHPGERPNELPKPVEPKKVENPGDAPSVVNNPGDAPSKVNEPTYPTDLINVSELEESMSHAYILNKIYKRDEYKDNVIIKVDEEVSINFNNKNKHIVKFYDAENNFICVSSPFSSGVIFNGVIPTYNYNSIYSSYHFIWVDENDNEVDLSSVNESKDLYAKIISDSMISYKITFVIDDHQIVKYYNYGETIIAPTNTYKEDEGDYYYTFIGWDKEISKATQEETYTAQYEKNHYVYCDVIIDNKTTTYKFFDDNFEMYLPTPYKEDNYDHYYEFSRYARSFIDPYHYTYRVIFNEYNYIYVSFVIDDQIIINNGKYKETIGVSYPYSLPITTKNNKVYKFQYWVDQFGIKVDLKNVTHSMTLYAHYEEDTSYNENTRFVYYLIDEEVVLTETYNLGEEVILPTLYKDSDENYYYEFKGFVESDLFVSDNMYFHAEFIRHNFYHVNVKVNNEISSYKLKNISELILPTDFSYLSSRYQKYVFKKWNINNVNEYEINYEAIFEINVTITFIYNNNFVEQTFDINKEITYESPIMDGNLLYYYEFAGWYDENNNLVELSSINRDIRLYAKFTQKYVEYKVTWIIGEDTIVDTYHYGDKLIIRDADSVINDTYYYEFISYENSLPETITSNIYLTINVNKKYYIIVSKEVLDEIVILKFKENETIKVNTPILNNDDHHDYQFIKWEIIQIDDHHYRYVADIKITNYFYITWMNEDVVLQKEKYVENSLISYKLDAPYKNAGEDFYYEFIGWDKSIENYHINEDITLYAQYKKLNKIKITWVYSDGSIVSYYMPNETIEIPDIKVTSYRDNVYFYSFSKWDISNNEVATKDKTINAIYNKQALIRANNKDMELSISNDVYSVNDANSLYLTNIDLSGIFSFFKYTDQIGALSLKAQEFELYISINNVRFLLLTDIVILKFSISISKLDVVEFSLSSYNKNDQMVKLDDINLELVLHYLFKNGHSKIFFAQEELEASFEDNVCTFRGLELNKEYKIITTYNITYQTSLNYEVILSNNNPCPFEQVNLTINPALGYKINSISIICNGENIDFIDGSFIMPRGDVTLVITSEMIEYHINFYVDNVLIASYVKHYGDLIVDPYNDHPELFEKPSDDEYRYVFKGWDKAIGKVTGDTNYVAVFESIPIVKDKIENKTSIIITLLIGVGVVLIAAAGVTTLVLVKRRHK